MTGGALRMTKRDTQDDRARHSRRQDGFTTTGKMECKRCHVERSETSYTLERFGAKDPSLALRMTEWAHRMTEWAHTMTKGTHSMTEGTPRMTEGTPRMTEGTLKIIGWHSR